MNSPHHVIGGYYRRAVALQSIHYSIGEVGREIVADLRRIRTPRDFRPLKIQKATAGLLWGLREYESEVRRLAVDLKVGASMIDGYSTELLRAANLAEQLVGSAVTSSDSLRALNGMLEFVVSGATNLDLSSGLASVTAFTIALSREINQFNGQEILKTLDTCYQEAVRQADEKAIDVETESSGDSMKPDGLAMSLVRFMLKVLPSVYRHRYSEELRGELHALATAGATRAMQIIYMLQQISRVVQLRTALHTPDRPRFHRLRQSACWILESTVRTWSVTVVLLFWGGAETATDTGMGAAIVFVVSGAAAYGTGVSYLRNRWNVQVKRPDREDS